MKKTFAQLKRDLKEGKLIKQLVNTVTGNPMTDVREISIVQSNAIAIKTKKNDELVNSWLYFPKSAKDVEYENNVFTFKTYGQRISYEIIENRGGY